jgi:hypothetical protein
MVALKDGYQSLRALLVSQMDAIRILAASSSLAAPTSLVTVSLGRWQQQLAPLVSMANVAKINAVRRRHARKDFKTAE